MTGMIVSVRDIIKVGLVNHKNHWKSRLCIPWGAALICAILAQARPVEAAERQISGFYEQGQRDTAEQYEESDLDYFYSKKYLRFDDQLTDQISGALAYRTVDKTYEQRPSSSNRYNQYQTFWEYLNKWQDASFKIDLDGEFKDQIFIQGSDDNQRTKVELGLAYTKEEDYFGRLRLGTTRINYLENTDKSEHHIKEKIEAGKYFLEKSVLLEGSGQKEDVDRNVGTDKSQYQGGLGLTWRAKTDWLDTLRLIYSRGQRNTREEEDDDFTVDYNFTQWGLSSKHEILPKFTVTLKYENVVRDYLVETEYNSFGYAAEADLKYEPIFGKHYYKLDMGYRARNYTVDPTRTNTKSFVILSAVYSFEPGWRAELAGEADFYRYPDNAGSSRNVWQIKPSLEKELLEGLKITLDYVWRFKDYLAADDAFQNVVRVGVEWGF